MIIPLLFIVVAFGSSSWAKPISVRLPASSEPFRDARTDEILRSRNVAVERFGPGEAWASLTADEQNEIRVEEQRLIQINHLGAKVMSRVGVDSGPLPAQARDQIRRLATDLAEWSGELSPKRIDALSLPLNHLARTVDRLNILDRFGRFNSESLQTRLEDLSEGVSQNTQRALVAANVTHDRVALRQAEIATLRLIAEAYLITGMGHAKPVFHAAARAMFHYALASLPVVTTYSLRKFAGVEWPWTVGTFVSGVASVLIPIEYVMVYVRPEAKLWLYPERLRAAVNRVLIGDMTEPSFWRLVRRNLESAAERDPAADASPLKQFLSTWTKSRPGRGSTVGFLESLQALTGFSPRRVLPAVFPSCAAELGGDPAP